jgi:thioredoxin-like negative regulator of GroEL
VTVSNRPKAAAARRSADVLIRNSDKKGLVSARGGILYKTRSILVLAILLGASQASAATSWKKSYPEALKVAKAENKLIFVDLFADWCSWCHRFEADIVPTEVFRKATANMVMLRVDTEDRGEGAQLAKRYGVTRLPTFLILTPDETIAALIQGYAPADQFVARMNGELTRYENLRRSLKASGKQSPEESLAIGRELVARQDYANAESRLQQLWADESAPAATRDEAGLLLGVAQNTRGKSAAALDTLRKVLARKPASETAQNARLQRASILLEQENYQAALAEYKAFKSDFPGSQHLSTVNLRIVQLEAMIARRASR